MYLHTINIKYLRTTVHPKKKNYNNNTNLIIVISTRVVKTYWLDQNSYI